jgi:hypothetical protein
MKNKINLLEKASNEKNIRDLYRGISQFKKCHQLTTNLVKDENRDLLAGSHNIFGRWENCLCYLLNILVINSVRHSEIHTSEILVLVPYSF